MCRMLGMMCNDADLLPCAVNEVHDSLALADTQGHDGVGIGSYNNDDPLLKRMPPNKEDRIDFARMVEGIASNALLIHVRKATIGTWKTDNTHPFRFRRWLFAHVGHLPAIETQRAQLIESLPGFLVRNLRGETDSELAFYMFLKSLFQDGTLNNLALTTATLQEYLRACASRITAMHTETKETPTYAIVVTNGQIMGAICHGVTMHYSMREGIHDCKCDDDSEVNQQGHGRFKGIMLGAAMTDPGHQWREVGNDSLLTISRELELKVQQI